MNNKKFYLRIIKLVSKNRFWPIFRYILNSIDDVILIWVYNSSLTIILSGLA